MIPLLILDMDDKMLIKSLLFSVLTISSVVNAQLVKSDPNAGLDYRSVSYEDLLPSLEQFFDDGVGQFSQLLFDTPHHQLIAGLLVSYLVLLHKSYQIRD